MQFAICWVYAIKSRHSRKICLSSKLLQVNSYHCFLHDSTIGTCDDRDELEALNFYYKSLDKGYDAQNYFSGIDRH
ncbi:MAG: hypothetical protein ACI9O6_000457 [Glaciecola sp.]|jgi:hypothetical protein